MSDDAAAEGAGRVSTEEPGQELSGSPRAEYHEAGGEEPPQPERSARISDAAADAPTTATPDLVPPSELNEPTPQFRRPPPRRQFGASLVDAAKGSFTSAVHRAPYRLKTRRGRVVAVSAFLSFAGMVLIFVKLNSLPAAARDAADIGGQRHGAMALVIFAASVFNLLSYRDDDDQLVWVSAALCFTLLDVNVCRAHTLFETDTDDALRAGYTLLLLGTLGSFAAFPTDASATPAADESPTGDAAAEPSPPPAGAGPIDCSSRALSGVALCVVLVVGNCMLWAQDGVCHEAASLMVGGELRTKKYPIYVGRAAYIAVWHAASLLLRWGRGRQLSYIIAVLSVADYQPFGPRCDWALCQAGVWTIFVGLWLLIVHHIMTQQPGAAARPSFRAQLTSGKGRAMLALVVCSVVGAGLVWAREGHVVYVVEGSGGAPLVPVGGARRDGHAHAQEAYDAGMLLAVTLIMWSGHLAGSDAGGVLALGLLFSVVNRCLCVGTFDRNAAQAGEPAVSTRWPRDFYTCPWQYGTLPQGIQGEFDAAVRLGYVLLFVGSLGSFYGLPVPGGWDLSSERLLGSFGGLGGGYAAADAAQRATAVGVVLLCCVAMLWADGRYYGQLGLTGVAHAAFAQQKYKRGGGVVYLVALLQIPTLTPFTTCEAPGSMQAVVCLIAMLCLCAIVVDHKKRRALHAVGV